jgi:hypothetical protein
MSSANKLARKMDPDCPQYVTIKLNPRQVEIINRLHAQGLHGNTCADVVRRLFCDGCLQHSEPEGQPFTQAELLQRTKLK